MSDDDIPLPPEPDDVDPFADEVASLPMLDLNEARARHERARAVHVRRSTLSAPLDATDGHPRGLDVVCPACRARVSAPCEHPTRRVTGFVHPSRLDLSAGRTPVA